MAARVASLRRYARAATVTPSGSRSNSAGCRGGSRPSGEFGRKVAHGPSRSRAQSPRQPKKHSSHEGAFRLLRRLAARLPRASAESTPLGPSPVLSNPSPFRRAPSCPATATMARTPGSRRLESRKCHDSLHACDSPANRQLSSGPRAKTLLFGRAASGATGVTPGFF
jgi:hypothetical protein